MISAPRLSGGLGCRAVDPERDLALVVGWMNEPHVARWWEQAWSVRRWRVELHRQVAGPHTLACLLTVDDVDVAYLELYRASEDVIAPHYPVGADDVGMHIAIGATDRTGQGLGTRLISEVSTALLREHQWRRVVAEPEAANTPSVRAFAAAGFVASGAITIADRDRVLMIREAT